MRYIVLLLTLGCLLFTTSAHSGLVPNDCDNYISKNYSNKCTDTVIRERRDAVGAGVNVDLYKDRNVDITQESKYDWNNGGDGGFSTYTVVKLKTEKGIFQHIGNWLKDLFDKE